MLWSLTSKVRLPRYGDTDNLHERTKMTASPNTGWAQRSHTRRNATARAKVPALVMVQATNTEDVWQEFHARLLSFISGRVQNTQDAEDILQDVFLRLHKHKDRLEEIENVTAWVYRITRNAIIDHQTNH